MASIYWKKEEKRPYFYLFLVSKNRFNLKFSTILLSNAVNPISIGNPNHVHTYSPPYNRLSVLDGRMFFCVLYTIHICTPGILYFTVSFRVLFSRRLYMYTFIQHPYYSQLNVLYLESIVWYRMLSIEPLRFYPIFRIQYIFQKIKWKIKYIRSIRLNEFS